MSPYEGAMQGAFLDRIQKLSNTLSLPDYGQFWEIYKARREKELRKESLTDALRKLSKTPFRELVKTITIEDVKRNFNRLLKVLIKPTWLKYHSYKQKDIN